MTTYTAPPDKTDLVLNFNDTLLIEAGGTAVGTTINGNNVGGGVEYVEAGGTAIDTTINDGSEIVNAGGTSIGTTINKTGVGGSVETVYGKDFDTTINNGGVEYVASGGTATDITINNGGSVSVFNGGTAIDTTINSGGREWVSYTSPTSFGTADNVKFGGLDATLQLSAPSGLKGTISDWRVSDVIDLLNTTVTGVSETGDSLTVTYGNSQKVIYTLAGQQAHTQVSYQSDGHGGTDLILTPITGFQPLQSEGGHLLFG